MKRFGLFGVVLACSLALQAKTLYLVPNANWKKDNARFAVYAFDNGEAWYSMTAVSGKDGVYQADVDDKYPQVIFCRMNPAEPANNWNDNVKWNQTDDLYVPSDKNQYTVAEDTWDKGGGTWSVYGQSTPEPGEGGQDPVTPSDYATAVPSQCEDVMLQGFYWYSFQDKGFGDTKWATLSSQASEIGKYFSLIWLPPSHEAKDAMGYIASCYSSQSTGGTFGKKAVLESLIAALHTNGVRVLADIVINHCGNNNSACNFNALDFGTYGQFAPQENWMTSNDEGVTDYSCHGGSHADDGQNGSDANYKPARDWDHQNENVQKMCKAYLQWMKNVMKYDGFRFDMTGGYHMSHLSDYIPVAKPYFSVMEYWKGDANELKTRIDETGKKTLAFDFAAKYTVFHDGIYKKDYTKCQNGGLRGKGYSRYAVTFIDNHDTFARSGDKEPSDVADKKDGSSVNDKSLIMRCNAYLLSMPGVPCVFWPHWVKYKSDIQAMITARKKAGIHSESAVEESAGNGYYKATVTGKYGKVVLYLGSAANESAPAGYTQAVKGSDYAMYYTGNGKPEQGVETVTENGLSDKGQKFLRDGKLYIRCGGKIYDAQGRIIQ